VRKRPAAREIGSERTLMPPCTRLKTKKKLLYSFVAVNQAIIEAREGSFQESRYVDIQKKKVFLMASY